MSCEKLMDELNVDKETIKEEWEKIEESDVIQQMKSARNKDEINRFIYRMVKQRLGEKEGQVERLGHIEQEEREFSIRRVIKLGLQQLGYDVSSNDRFFGEKVDLYAVQGEKEHVFWIIESDSETVDPFALAKKFDRPIHLNHIHVHGDLNTRKVSEHHFETKKEKVLDLIQENETVDRSTILRQINIEADLLDRVVKKLVENGKIEEEVKGTETRGRPKRLYHLLKV